MEDTALGRLAHPKLTIRLISKKNLFNVDVLDSNSVYYLRAHPH